MTTPMLLARLGMLTGMAHRAFERKSMLEIRVFFGGRRVIHPVRAANVTPSDAADLPAGSHWLSFTYGGSQAIHWQSFTNSGSQTIQIATVGGEKPLILTGLATAVLHPMRAKRVRSANTTGANILAYWT